jgi:hypothetical protein
MCKISLVFFRLLQHHIDISVFRINNLICYNVGILSKQKHGML